MRLVLRFSMLLMVAGFAWSQAITDAAAMVAGSSVGAGAGKKVGEGISSVFNKVDATVSKAAKSDKGATGDKSSAKQKGADSAVLQVGPGGVVKDHSLVPPPPPAKKAAVVPPPPPIAPVNLAVLPPTIVLPPPPHATPEALKTVAGGTPREEVLKLGPPSSRITMFDDGHLVEIYRYQTRDTTFGVVRLSDGSVSNVQVR